MISLCRVSRVRAGSFSRSSPGTGRGPVGLDGSAEHGRLWRGCGTHCVEVPPPCAEWQWSAAVLLCSSARCATVSGWFRPIHVRRTRMARRRGQGSETWNRLREWDKGSAASERLAGHLLRAEGYQSVDPSHPLGGRDGLKDIVCTKDGIQWRSACFFPRRPQTVSAIEKKFIKDLGDLTGEQGFVFLTNQEITAAARKMLLAKVPSDRGDLFHLERIVSILDSPVSYGVRLEFLDIEMTKDEQLSFFASRDTLLSKLHARLDQMASALDSIKEDPEKVALLRTVVPLDDLKEFTKLLESIASPNLWLGSTISFQANVSQLRVPLEDLREFEKILSRICPSPFLQVVFPGGPTVAGLRVPLKDLQEYEATLDRIVSKTRRIRPLKGAGGA